MKIEMSGIRETFELNLYDSDEHLSNFNNLVRYVAREDYQPRPKWANKAEFVLSVIGYAVGLGNVWRFPYLCYKNGGGAFLIPYFICVLTGGIPIFLLEIGLGQYTSEGGITAWNICPALKGIGFATTIINFSLNAYYIVILAWAIHYFFSSLTTVLPWSHCDNWWNTIYCYSPNGPSNFSRLAKRIKIDSAVEYWEKRVLGLSHGVDEIGGIQWELAAALLLAWILIYFCIRKGIKTSGKVVYFTALFPYVMLIILFIRGISLDGASSGIMYYIKPDFTKLLDSQVWIDAGTQVFFSYAIALGCMIALGSYNKFHNNFARDCLCVAAINSGTSIFAGFAIFSVLGHMAKQQDVPISHVAESGPGLVFIAYPNAVSQMPYSPLWSALFFFMIILMGIDSQFVGVEGFITAVVDRFPFYFSIPARKDRFIIALCVFNFFIGLMMVTRGGMYIFQLFDYYSASGMVLLSVCFWESICISYFYGIDRFCKNITSMIGYEIHPWFRYCWLYFTPAITVGIFIFYSINAEPLTYNRYYKYPTWALGFGWTLGMIPMLTIPGYLIYYVYSRPGFTLKQKWNQAIESKITEANVVQH